MCHLAQHGYRVYVVPILNFHEDADAELTLIESDASRADLVARIGDVLGLLSVDPTHQRLRRRRFTNGLWAALVYDGDDCYGILWDGEDLPESVTVLYVGLMP